MKEHYSYRVYADAETARRFDSERFGGAIGEYIRATQERLVFRNLPQVTGWQVIDVGAGTGRFTMPFLANGASVTACDASSEMLNVLTEKCRHPNLRVMVADAHQLDFPDRSFDCAISFRILLHVIDWKKALSELCRVSKDWVIFDFPPRHGFLLLAPVWHRFSRLFSNRIQPYRTIGIAEVRQELSRNGLHIVATDPGFFLPLVVHRKIGSPRFMQTSEKLFLSSGLSRLAGSPVTLFARRNQ